MKNVGTIDLGKYIFLVFILVMSSSCSEKAFKPYLNEKYREKIGAYEMYLKLTFDCTEATKANYNQATLWLKKALVLGDERALYPLAHRLLWEESLDSINEGLAMLTKSAKLGNVESSRELGDIFLEGKIVDKDIDKSREWYDKAARQGHIQAMIIYSKLIGSEDKLAWILLASNRIDTESMTGVNLSKRRKELLSYMSKEAIQKSLTIYFELVHNIPFLDKRGVNPVRP